MSAAIGSVWVLVFHGSRDPRSQQAATVITQQVQHQMQLSQRCPAVPAASSGGQSPWGRQAETVAIAPVAPLAIADAYLECQPLPLSEQLVQIVQQATGELPGRDGPLRVQVIPVLLLAGVHVREDIPAAVAIAQAQLPPTVQWEITHHLGSCAELHQLVRQRLTATPLDGWILLAHGSRRPGANQVIETLAAEVGAIAAYWATPPDLATQIQALQQQGRRRIGILPYFLSSGGITDAISQTVTTLTQRDPNLSLSLAETLDHNAAIADILVALAQRSNG